MKFVSCSVPLALLLICIAFTQAKGPKPPDPTKDLVPAPILEKLELTDEQKTKLAPIQKDFEKQVHVAREKAKDKKDANERITKIRAEVEPKLQEILTDEQKTKLEELRKEAAAAEEPKDKDKTPKAKGKKDKEKEKDK